MFHITNEDEINAFCDEIKIKLLYNSKKYFRDHFKEIISNAEKQNNRYRLSYLILKKKLLKESFLNDISSNYTSLLESIIDEDVNLFISFTGQDEFSPLKAINFDFIPCVEKSLNILEICCYCGSIDCFKFIRTKFHASITKLTLSI